MWNPMINCGTRWAKKYNTAHRVTQFIFGLCNLSTGLQIPRATIWNTGLHAVAWKVNHYSINQSKVWNGSLGKKCTHKDCTLRFCRIITKYEHQGLYETRYYVHFCFFIQFTAFMGFWMEIHLLSLPSVKYWISSSSYFVVFKLKKNLFSGVPILTGVSYKWYASLACLSNLYSVIYE